MQHHSILRKYLMKEELGRGSYGSAYRIIDRETGMSWVLKMANLSHHQENPKEIALMTGLQHPMLVRLREYEFIPVMDRHGRPLPHQGYQSVHMVLNYCAGGTLKQHLCRYNFMPEAAALKVFAQVALAIEFMHSKKVLHRDIKSDNIFLWKRFDGNPDNVRVMMGDLGISRAIDPTMGDVALTMCGTPLYMSPECLVSKDMTVARPVVEKGYSYKADVWSLGVLLYELVSGGHNPFYDYTRPQEDAHRELRDNILGSKPLPLPPHVSPQVRNLIWWALEKNHARRPTVADMLLQPCMTEALSFAITLSVKDFKVSVPEAERAGPDLEHKFQMCIASGMEQYHRIASKAKTGSFTVCPTYGVDGPGPRHNPAVADPQPVYVRARADGGPVHDQIAAYNQQRLAHQEARAAAAYAKVGYAAQGPSPNGARQPKLRSPESKAAPAMVPLPSYNGPRYMQDRRPASPSPVERPLSPLRAPSPKPVLSPSPSRPRSPSPSNLSPRPILPSPSPLSRPSTPSSPLSRPKTPGIGTRIKDALASLLQKSPKASPSRDRVSAAAPAPQVQVMKDRRPSAPITPILARPPSRPASPLAARPASPSPSHLADLRRRSPPNPRAIDISLRPHKYDDHDPSRHSPKLFGGPVARSPSRPSTPQGRGAREIDPRDYLGVNNNNDVRVYARSPSRDLRPVSPDVAKRGAQSPLLQERRPSALDRAEALMNALNAVSKLPPLSRSPSPHRPGPVSPQPPNSPRSPMSAVHERGRERPVPVLVEKKPSLVRDDGIRVSEVKVNVQKKLESSIRVSATPSDVPPVPASPKHSSPAPALCERTVAVSPAGQKLTAPADIAAALSPHAVRILSKQEDWMKPSPVDTVEAMNILRQAKMMRARSKSPMACRE